MPATTLGMREILLTFFGTQGSAIPDPWYVGLSTAVLTSASIDGSSCNEVSGGSYARVSLANTDSGDWTAATTGSLLTDNLNVCSFPESTAIWGTVNTVFIADASTNGNIYWYAVLSPSIYVGDNTTLSFAVNTLIVTMS